jgi:hypothetical protein
MTGEVLTIPDLTIAAFFERSAGKWFSQRTSYHLAQAEQWHQSDKTDVYVELAEAGDSEVATLCRAVGIDPAQAIAALKTRWDKSLLKGTGGMVMVAIASSPEATVGKLVVSAKTPGAKPQVGRYVLNTDGSLMLTTQADGVYAEERLWFAAPNLRLRTSLMRRDETGFSTSSFYSEIRMNVPAPQA